MLIISNLHKSFGNKQVLKDINLTIEPGDLCGFIGPNGAGKTTTIKCVIGLLDFEQGEITFNGLNIRESPLEFKEKIAYIPDNPDLYEFFTGREYLNFVADIFKIPIVERRTLINEYSQKLGILDNLSELVSSYYHGMKQKLAIISALIHKPKLLILDEPFVGLDPHASHIVKEEFKRMCSEGASVFFSSHVLEVVEKLCNKVCIIREGEIIISGDTDKVVENSSLEDIFMELVSNE